jgi:hypothetical protein
MKLGNLLHTAPSTRFQVRKLEHTAGQQFPVNERGAASGVRKCRIVDMTSVRAQLVAACSLLFNSNLLRGVEEQAVAVLASLGPVVRQFRARPVFVAPIKQGHRCPVTHGLCNDMLPSGMRT